MDIPKDLLAAYFCKWEQKHFEEFNIELVKGGMNPITFDEYTKLLTDIAKEDDWLAPTPRIR